MRINSCENCRFVIESRQLDGVYYICGRTKDHVFKVTLCQICDKWEPNYESCNDFYSNKE